MSKLTPIILIVFSAIIFFGFIDQEYQKVKVLKEEKVAIDDVLNKAQKLLKRRDDLQNKYNVVPKDNLSRIETMLPDNIDNVKLVLDIDRIAKEKGISIKNITVNTGNQVGDDSRKVVVINDSSLYGVATINFSVSASYEVFLKFLRDLEDGLRIVDITSLALTPTENAYNYTVTFKTYWLK